jgi:hypothetical protein
MPPPHSDRLDFFGATGDPAFTDSRATLKKGGWPRIHTWTPSRHGRRSHED